MAIDPPRKPGETQLVLRIAKLMGFVLSERARRFPPLRAIEAYGDDWPFAGESLLLFMDTDEASALLRFCLNALANDGAKIRELGPALAGEIQAVRFVLDYYGIERIAAVAGELLVEVERRG